MNSITKDSLKDALVKHLSEAELEKAIERYGICLDNLFSGVLEDPDTLIHVVKEDYEGIVSVKKIDFRSICSHDLLPFFGQVHISYIPNEGKIATLGSIMRAVDVLGRRPQLQEGLSKQILNILQRTLNAKAVLVVVEAEHVCLRLHSKDANNSRFITMIYTGIFETDVALRQQALSLIGFGEPTDNRE